MCVSSEIHVAIKFAHGAGLIREVRQTFFKFGEEFGVDGITDFRIAYSEYDLSSFPGIKHHRIYC